MTQPSVSDLAIIRRLFGYARSFWPHIAGLALLSLLSMPLALLAPFPLKIAVDSVTGEHGLPWFVAPFVPDSVSRSQSGVLLVAVAMLIGLAVLSQVLGLAEAFLRTYTGERLVLDFRSRLFRHAQRLSLAYHDSRGSSDSVYRIQSDAPSIQHVTMNGTVPLLSALITLVTMVFVIVLIDWQLAVVALCVGPVVFAISRLYKRPLRRRYEEVKDIETSTLHVLQEALGAIRVVKAFNAEEREDQRFVRHSGAGTQARIRLGIFQSGFDILMSLTSAAGTAAVLVVGGYQVQTEQLTVGELLVAMSYLTQLLWPLKTISSKAADIQSSLASAQRAFALLDQTPDVVERPEARPLKRAVGRFSCRHVSFAYDAGRLALRDVNLDVPPGARVGIAGPTGAGKTTLANLLSRFYDPLEGCILLDGVDLRDYRLADLRNQFSIVLQEPVLFSTSIGENIAYALPDASDAQIVAAAEAASIHDFISTLPDGYATLVGERGMRLSGGERQRISLARAFLKNAPILILDEPTSAVDVKTEANIVDALDRLMAGRTTFMIAHRLSTLEGCDVRLEIKDGRVRSSAGPRRRTPSKRVAVVSGETA